MVYVVLRTHKVLQYNSADSISVEAGTITLRAKDEKWLVGRIPLDIVERVEFEKPCRITREKQPR